MPYIGNSHNNVGEHVNNFKVLDDISSYTATFDGSATGVVSTTNETIRVADHRFLQGQRVTYNNGGGSNIGGLTSGTAYYISLDTANTVKLATSLVNANNNTVINLSSVGSGSSHTLTAAFDGVNKEFKLTYGTKAAIVLTAPQLNIAINNVIQRPNLNPLSFTEGFAVKDGNKIIFQSAPQVNDVFWGSITSNSISVFDVEDNAVDNFTGDGSTTNFTLSSIPPNKESILVTLDGVLQHPSDNSTTRAYTIDASVVAFTSAPASGVAIQVRHIGFASPTTPVRSFYGRTGNVTLNNTDDIVTRNINSSGIITASSFSGSFSGAISGTTISATSATFSGDVSIGGTLTYEDVKNVDSVGFITARSGILVQDDATFTGAVGNMVFDKSDSALEFGDNVKLKIGDHGDIQIYNDGTRSVIENGGSSLGGNNNSLHIYSQNDILHNTTYSQYFHCGAANKNSTSPIQLGLIRNAGVKAYYNNNLKLETSPNGVDITGGLTVSGITTFSNHAYFGNNVRAIFATNSRLQILSNGTNSYLDYAGSLNVRGSSGSAAALSFLSDSNVRVTNNLEISKDLDVDGHTELDNVNIAGVVTATQFKSVNGSNTGFFKDNQLSFSPTGHAYIDHGTTAKDIYFRLSRASALDTLMMQFDSDGEIIKFHKIISVGLQGGSDTATLGGGSGVGAQLTLKYADGTFNTRLLGNGNSYLNARLGNLGIGTDNPGTKLDVFGSLQVKDTAGLQNFFISDSGFKFNQTVSNWSNMTYTSSPVLAWDYKNGPGDLFYIGSGGNTEIANQMAMVISDTHGFKVGKSGYDGTDYDVSATNEFFRITTAGKVGINTATPRAVLDIEGNAENATLFLHSNDANANLAFSDNTGGARILNYGGDLAFRTGANAHAFGTNDSEKLRIEDNGSVGIGTDDASWGLSGNGGLVVGSGTGSQAITIFCAGNADLSFGNAKSGTARYKGLIRYSHSDDTMRFRTATSERLRIESNGNVTIGTDNNPGNALRYLDVANYNTGSSAGSILRLLTTKSDGTSAVGLDIVKYKAGGAYIVNYENVGADTGFIAFNTGSNGISPATHLRVAGNGEVVVSPRNGGASNNRTSIHFNNAAHSPFISFKSNNVTEACYMICSENTGGAHLNIRTKRKTGAQNAGSLLSIMDFGPEGEIRTYNASGGQLSYPLITGHDIGSSGAEYGQFNYHDMRSPAGGLGGWLELGIDYNGAHPYPVRAYKIARHENGRNGTRVYHLWHDGDANYHYGGMWEIRLNEWGSTSNKFESVHFRCINGRRNDVSLYVYGSTDGIWVRPHTIWGRLYLRRAGWDDNCRAPGSTYCAITNGAALAFGDTLGANGSIPSGYFELYPFDGAGGSHTGGRYIENNTNSDG